MTTASNYQSIILAVAIWREARSAGKIAKLAVKHVILNRVANPIGPYRNCRDIVSTILCPYQFSSFNRNDPNASMLPNPANPIDWQSWLECCDVVDTDDLDPTGGSNMYYSTDIPAPKWAVASAFKTQIGPFKFFKI